MGVQLIRSGPGLPVSALLLVAGAGLLVAGCTTGTSSAATVAPTSSVAATPAASAAATPSPSPSPTPDLLYANEGSISTWLIDEPLSALSPDAESLVEENGDIGVAVLVPSQGVVYETNGDEQFELASVAKVPIMLTLLSEATTEGRPLTDFEQYELTQMITLSDNDAADWLYGDVGGEPAVTAFLDSAGIDDADIDPDYWGESTLTPLDSAQLMADLAGGTILDDASRQQALGLLESVVPSEAWGAVASAASDGAETGVKNGWYPEVGGWVLNSTGYVVATDTTPDYTIAVFTYGQQDMSDGIATIEAIGSDVYAAMLVQGADQAPGLQ